MKSIECIDVFNNNPIKSFVNAGFHKYRANWGWERKCSHASLYYIAYGYLRFTVGNKTFIAKSGDVVFLRKSDDAFIYNEGDEYSELYFVAFVYDESVDLGISAVTESEGYIKLFKDILESYLSGARLSNLKISQLLLKLIYNLAKDNLKSQSDYSENARLLAAAEYININYYKDISIDHLSKLSGYSEPHLRRLFIKHFGVSPKNYIINKRIEMAKEMLLEIPEKTVDEIADLLGICSASYFCKLFKSKEGISPLDFKKRFKNG